MAHSMYLQELKRQIKQWAPLIVLAIKRSRYTPKIFNLYFIWLSLCYHKRFLTHAKRFHMRCLSGILDIKWSNFVDNKLSHKKFRTCFNNIRRLNH